MGVFTFMPSGVSGIIIRVETDMRRGIPRILETLRAEDFNKKFEDEGR